MNSYSFFEILFVLKILKNIGANNRLFLNVLCSKGDVITKTLPLKYLLDIRKGSEFSRLRTSL